MPLRVSLPLLATMAYTVEYGLQIGFGAGLPVIPDDARMWIYCVVLGACAAVCGERARARRAERAAWAAIALGMAVWTAAELYWTIWLADATVQPYPSLADALWLGSYLPLGCGLLLLGRERVGRPPTVLLLDATLVALAAAAVGAAVVVDAVYRAGAGVPLSTLATNLAYPVTDLILIALLGAVVALNGWRLGRDWWAVTGGLLILTTGDSAYAYQVAANTYVLHELTDLTWLLAFWLLAVGAWQAPKQASGEVAHRRLVIAPAVVAAAMLAVVTGAGRLSPGPVAMALAVASLGVVIVRMAVSVAHLDRANTQLAAAHRRAEQLARTDSLTGLWNRRYMAERIREELARVADGQAADAAVALVDIDHFKLINDRYGHPAGDRVLLDIARRLRTAVGPADLVGRWGGEEYCVLLVGVGPFDDLQDRCEELRRAVAHVPAPIDEQRSCRVTCSVGATRAGVDVDRGLESALHRADRALYAAKDAGRNRTVISGETTPDRRTAETDDLRLARIMAITTSLRDNDTTSLHWQQVSDLAGATARRLGLSLDVVHRCEVGGLIHDIGKIGLPDSLLRRVPIASDDRARLRTHAEVGAKLADEIDLLGPSAAVVRHHHERFDGSGYPDGLAGDDIPIEARIVAACDAYSAITAERPYQVARTQEEAFAELRRCAGRHLDPEVVDALLGVLVERRAAAARHFGRYAA